MSNEQGFVSRSLIITLLVLVVLALAAIDAGAVVLARLQAQDLADRSAQEAAFEYKNDATIEQSCQKAIDYVKASDPAAAIPQKKGCVVDVETGSVTVVVRKDVTTVAAKHISVFEDFLTAEGTATAARPGL